MVQIDVLSPIAPINLPGSKLTNGTFESANVSEVEGELPISRTWSRYPSCHTPVDGKCKPASLSTVNWIAGVGDVCNRELREVANQGQSSRAHQWTKVDLPGRSYTASTCDTRQDPQWKRSALQRHCDFWDSDHDGLIYPWDIYIGFRKLGFNSVLCLWAAITMPICSSYGTQASWCPHPLFAINLDNIHRSRHGSTTGTYDMDAEIDSCRYNAIFTKYAEGKDYLTLKTLYSVWAGQCCANDWFGWFAGGLECKFF
jgi:hypothetical protein